MRNSNIWIDVIGWIGAIALIVAYILVSTRKSEGDSTLYQLLNVTGGALLMFNSFFYGAYPSSALNVVWIGIAVYAMSKRKFRTHRGP